MGYKFYISDQEEQDVQETIDDISKKYPVEEAPELPTPLSEFFLLKDYLDVSEYRTIRITQRQNPSYVSFIQVQSGYHSKSGSGTISDLQGYVFVKLCRNYGHIIIKKETLRDKLNELLQPMELDFEDDKQFSRKFYVLAKDKDKALHFITSNFREELKKIHPDVYIEVVNDVMMITNKKHANDAALFELLDFGYTVSCIK